MWQLEAFTGDGSQQFTSTTVTVPSEKPLVWSEQLPTPLEAFLMSAPAAHPALGLKDSAYQKLKNQYRCRGTLRNTLQKETFESMTASQTHEDLALTQRMTLARLQDEQWTPFTKICGDAMVVMQRSIFSLIHHFTGTIYQARLYRSATSRSLGREGIWSVKGLQAGSCLRPLPRFSVMLHRSHHLQAPCSVHFESGMEAEGSSASRQ